MHTLHITITATVVLDPGPTDSSKEGLQRFAEHAKELASDRVADWFRGLPVRIHTTADVTPQKLA